MDKLFDVVSIGSADQDVFVRSSQAQVIDFPETESGQALCVPLGAKLDVETLKHEVGGGAVNTSVSFTRLGLRAGLVARVGSDLAGQHIRDVVKSEGVDTSRIIADPHKSTGQSIILLAPNGNRTVMVYRGAGADFHAEDIDENLIRQTEWVYVSAIGGNLSVLRRIFGLCHLHEVKIAWNPGGLELAHGLPALAPLLQQTDLLLLNREEAALLTHLPHHATAEVLKQLIFLISKGEVVVTDGSHGASVYDGQQIETIPGKEVLVVDATGAGDALGSGYLAAHMAGRTVEQCLSFALANAESVIGAMGAQAGLLRQDALQARKVTPGIQHLPVSPRSSATGISA